MDFRLGDQVRVLNPGVGILAATMPPGMARRRRCGFRKTIVKEVFILDTDFLVYYNPTQRLTRA